MFLTKKKVISALVLGGAGTTAAVIYALKGNAEEAPISVKRSQQEIDAAAKKIVDEIGELDSGGVF